MAEDGVLSFPIIATERLLLRQMRPDDQAFVFQGLSHPDVIRYYGVEYATFEETKAQMDWYAQIWLEQTGIWWALTDRASGACLGACGLNYWVKKHRKAETGYWLLPEHWGKGYMQEALPRILDYGFQHMQLHRIEALVETENHGSKALLSKFGFVLEGTMRECEIKRGRWISLDMFARLSSVALEDRPDVTPG